MRYVYFFGSILHHHVLTANWLWPSAVLYSRKDGRSSEHETCVEWHSKVLDIIGDMICHTFPGTRHWWRLITNYYSCWGNVSEIFTPLYHLESSKGDLYWKTCEIHRAFDVEVRYHFQLGILEHLPPEPNHRRATWCLRCVAHVSKLPFLLGTWLAREISTTIKQRCIGWAVLSLERYFLTKWGVMWSSIILEF